jgi:hypothetical protein
MTVLTVFDPAHVPTGDIADFLHWYDLATEWVEDRDYDSTDGTSAPLVPWLETMAAEFQPVVDGATGTTRYIIGSTCVYARFAERYAADAEARARQLAGDHGLGVYVAGSGEVTLADGSVLS